MFSVQVLMSFPQNGAPGYLSLSFFPFIDQSIPFIAFPRLLQLATFKFGFISLLGLFHQI